MKKRTRIALMLFTIVAVIVAASAFAADPKTVAPTSKPVTQQAGMTQPAPIKRVECVVAGATEFPVSIQIHNTGTALIPKGWIVNWSIPNTSRAGKYTLKADLAVNGYEMASNQLPGGHPAGAVVTCSVSEPLVAAARPRKPVAVQTTLPNLAQFDCVVQGSPVEFPDDVLITNKLANTVAKGKTIHWSVPNTTRQGDWVLTEDLLAGKSVFVTGAIPGGMSAGVKCDAQLK